MLLSYTNHCATDVFMCAYQVSPEFEEENAEQRPSVSNPDLFPSECIAVCCLLPWWY